MDPSESLRQALEKFLIPEVAARLADDPAALHCPLPKARPELVLALARDDDPKAAAERVKRITDLALSAEGVVEAILGSLVLITFGSILGREQSCEDPPASRRFLVARLIESLPLEVAILHGNGEAVVGAIGGKRFHYGSFFANFSEMLKALGRLQMGAVVEWDKEFV